MLQLLLSGQSMLSLNSIESIDRFHLLGSSIDSSSSSMEMAVKVHVAYRACTTSTCMYYLYSNFTCKMHVSADIALFCEARIKVR